jgi:hypothetical protein
MTIWTCALCGFEDESEWVITPASITVTHVDERDGLLCLRSTLEATPTPTKDDA